MRPSALLCVLWLVPQLASANNAALKKVVAGNNQFAFDLYGRIKARPKQKPENVFCSPYSISTALAMTYAGARGETAAQMAKVLRLTLPPRQLHAGFKALLVATRGATRGGANTLSVANALWGQRGYKFAQGFLALTRSHYGAGLKEVDFAGELEAARQTINRWVEGQTAHKIKELIAKRVLDSQTRLVLTNAIYFKGTWQIAFAKDATREQPFHLLGGGEVRVPLMLATDEFGYLDGGSFSALELPYKGRQLSMVVLLPKSTAGLAQLEQQLDAAWLSRTTKSLQRTKVQVYLPRFKTTSAFELGDTLKSMGMPLPFSGGADFSGMTGKKELRISKVIHKAFVDVNEEGTEAAAATAVVMARGGPAKRVPVFRADHPFTFLIMDKTSGSLLFVGRVVNPAS